MTVAALAHGAQVYVVVASDSHQIETAFATLVCNHADALIIGADPFYYGRQFELATLATRHGVPSIYNTRDYPEAGGLMSYGTSLTRFTAMPDASSRAPSPLICRSCRRPSFRHQPVNRPYAQHRGIADAVRAR